jgi:hypothetical protein
MTTLPYYEPNPCDLPTRIDLMQLNLVAAFPIADQPILGGRIFLAALATSAAPTIVITGGAAATQTYVVVAKLGSGYSAAGAVGTTAGAGPTTLNSTHYNTLSWAAIAGATSYDVYRVSGGASQGLIANTTDTSLVDNGLVGDSSTAPSVGISAVLAGHFQEALAAYSADGAIGAPGVAMITKGSAAALTLAAPIAGAPAAGGMDGLMLEVIATTAFAHTVTTPSNKLNGTLHIATFGGAVGDYIRLRAYNGVWYSAGRLNVTLS